MGRTPWLYGPISREEAEGWWRWTVAASASIGSKSPPHPLPLQDLAKDDGATDGMFLVRSRPEATGKEYILLIIFKGRATHHLIKQGDDGTLVINGKITTPVKTIRDVCCGGCDGGSFVLVL